MEYEYFPFSNLELTHISNKKLLKRTFLFDLHEGIINNPCESIHIYVVTIKNLIYSNSIQIINILKTILIDPKSQEFDKYFLKKYAYNVDINNNNFSLIYLKQDSQYLNYETLKNDLNNKINKNYLIKFEIIRKLAENLKELKDYDLDNTFLNLSYGIIHPDLIFHSFTKGYFYFDFIFVILLEIIRKEYETKNTSLIDNIGIEGLGNLDFYYSNILKEFYDKLSSHNQSIYNYNEIEINQLTLNLIFLITNSFKKDKISKLISYENILSIYQKDLNIGNTTNNILNKFISYDLKLEKNLHEDFLNFLNYNLSQNDLVEFSKGINEIIKNYVKYFDCDILECESRNEKIIINIKQKIHRICNHLLCEKCFNNHNCELIKNPEIKYNTKLSENKNYEFLQLKMRIDFIGNINNKETFNNSDKGKKIKQNFSIINSTQKKVKLNLKNSEKILYTFLLVLNNEINNLIDSQKIEINSKLKKLENIIKTNRSNKTNNNIKEITEISEYLNKEIKTYEEYIKSSTELKNKINDKFKINNVLNSIKRLSQKYTNDIKQINKNLKSNQSNHLLENNINNFITENNLEKENSTFTREYLNNNSNDNKIDNNYCKYVAGIDYKNNLIHLMSREFKKPKLIKPKEILLLNSKWLNMKSKLIITGGFDNENNKISNSVYYMDYETENLKIEKILMNNKKSKVEIIQLIQLPNMINPRDQHSMIIQNNFNIICVGGSETKSCEKFNFLDKKWISLADLNEVKFNCNLFLRNEKDLFLFFGLKKNENKNKTPIFSDQIERLCLYSEIPKWEVISYIKDMSFLYKNIFNNNFGLIYSGIIKYSQNNIFILGGIMAEDPNISKYSFKYNFETNTLSYDKVAFNRGLCFNENMFVQVGVNEFNSWSSDMLYVKLYYD